MTTLSDTLTVGLVLVLLFGSIALYLYTRIQQAEQKISLLESILLDLKMSTEIKSYTELPADIPNTAYQVSTEKYTPLDEIVDIAPNSTVSYVSVDVANSEVNQYKSVIAEAVNDVVNEGINGGRAVDEVASDNNVNRTDKTSIEHVVAANIEVAINYDIMTLKELQGLAKSRGITGAGSMKKGAIIEALKTSDRSKTSTVEPGSFDQKAESYFEVNNSHVATEMPII